MNLVVKHFNELSSIELYKILRARSDVFIGEQNCACEDIDGKDLAAYHVYLEDDGELCAYLRVLDRGINYSEVSLGRILTIKRGEGLGMAIVKEGIRVAREQFGAQKIKIGAQTYARGFYEKAGFRQVSEEYTEGGIPHIYMVLEES